MTPALATTVVASAVPSLATVVLLVGWVAAGLAVGTALAHRGQPVLVSASALVFWPILAPTLLTSPPRPEGRVHLAFVRLRDALRDAGEPEPPDLDVLRDALLANEGRIARVAAMLTEDAPPEELALLREAHARAGADLDGLLGEVGRVRVQLGLAALAGDTADVRARLTMLLARARSAEELAGLRAPAREG